MQMQIAQTVRANGSSPKTNGVEYRQVQAQICIAHSLLAMNAKSKQSVLTLQEPMIVLAYGVADCSPLPAYQN